MSGTLFVNSISSPATSSFLNVMPSVTSAPLSVTDLIIHVTPGPVPVARTSDGPGDAFNSNVRSSRTATGGDGGPNIGPKSMGDALTLTVCGWNVRAVAGSRTMRPLTVMGLVGSTRTPVRSTPLTEIDAVDTSGGAPGRGGIMARSVYSPGDTLLIVNVPSGRIMPPPPPMGPDAWLRGINITDPCFIGRPWLSSTIPLTRAVRVGTSIN